MNSKLFSFVETYSCHAPAKYSLSTIGRGGTQNESRYFPKKKRAPPPAPMRECVCVGITLRYSGRVHETHDLLRGAPK